MWYPFKKRKQKATPQQIGIALVEMISAVGKQQVEIQASLDFIEEQKRPAVFYEILLMQGFVNDYATFLAFGNKPIKDNILRCYYTALDAFARQDDIWHVYDAELRKRVMHYTTVLESRNMDDQYTLEFVGEVFAELCGEPQSLLLQTTGATEFGSRCAENIRFLYGFDITPN